MFFCYTQTMRRIYSLHDYEQYLSAFSAHAIEYKGIVYSTVEHAYHCQRYADESIQKEIRDARSAYKAWGTSQKYKDKERANWKDQKAVVMEELCRAKLSQHEDVKQALIESREDVIVKDYPDAFWGIGMDGEGRNEMCKIWMKLRAELKS